MDETETDDVVTVGQRLREAREAKAISIEDIAAQTRIPTRHLASLEAGDWEKLPAATYTVGFAKNYAGAVGLDRDEIGEQLRAEMGNTRVTYAQPEVYEAADPARTMPKGLVFGALALLALVVLALSWLNNRSLQPDEVVAPGNVAAPATNELTVPAIPATAQPVVLTARDAVWLEVKDGSTTLIQGELKAGDRFEVPASAGSPVLTTGKPEALVVTVGTRQAPPIGTPGRTVSGVSLKAEDLLRQEPAASPASDTQGQASGAARPASSGARRSTPTQAPPSAPEPEAAAMDTPGEPGAGDISTQP